MKKSILVALVAATALAPLAASAQEWQGRGRNRGGDAAAGQPRGDGGGRGRGGDAGTQQRPADNGGWRSRGDNGGDRPAFDRNAGRQPRAEAPQQQPAAPAFQPTQPAGGAYQRGNAGDWRRGAQAGQDFRNERRDDRQDFRGERRDDRRAFANGQVTPQQYRQDRRGDRQDYRGDRRDDRQDFRRDYGNRGAQAGNWNRGGDWNRSGNWNRGWRNDNRYDWRGWRNGNRYAYRLPRYYAPRGYGYGYQRFSIGVTLGALLFSQNYWIDDPWTYRLPEAYGPYRWVRYYNDALLVDIETGEVVDTIYDIFW